MNHCCEKFAKEASEVRSDSPGTSMPPVQFSRFEPDRDGQAWNVSGCCGGHCYVVTGMKFCPFCGSKLGESQ